jgi:hypothetical protein
VNNAMKNRSPSSAAKRGLLAPVAPNAAPLTSSQTRLQHSAALIAIPQSATYSDGL